jgi:hypothetical protein
VDCWRAFVIVPWRVEFCAWVEEQHRLMPSDKYEHIGTSKEQCLFSRCVICADGVVHLIEDLVPGSGKFLFHFYYWGYGGGGVVRWPC